jgi:3-phenylpropionate/trans-cinnamate dioxygenase ferredoxin reductase subunit
MIVVVGAGAAGLSAGSTLRELGYAGALRLFSAERATPYERPCLSKGFLVSGERGLREIRSMSLLAKAGIRPELGVEVKAIDTRNAVVTTSAGEDVRYEQLLLATGAEPRRLNLPGADSSHVHYLRDVRDARKLRSALRPGASVAILGGGVVGLEVASSASVLGADVTVVELEPHIMGRIVPPGLAGLLEDFHRGRGIAIRTGVRPVSLEDGRSGGRTVRLENGELVPADVVIMGVGAVPRADLAARAGLDVDDGVVVDGGFRSSDKRIFAAGDVARVFHAREGRHVRIEQWQPAEYQGSRAAACMLGVGETYRDLPWMWSDQNDLHLQATGFGFADVPNVVVRGRLDERGGVTCLGIDDCRLVAACGASIGTGVAKSIRAARILMELGVPVDGEQLRSPDLDLHRMARHARRRAQRSGVGSGLVDPKAGLVGIDARRVCS